MIFNFDKVLKIINDRKDIKKLKFIFFLNFINFTIEIITLVSIPIFAALLLDKNFINKKFDIDLTQYFGSENILISFGVFIIFLFLIKNIFLIFLTYLQTNFTKNLKIKVAEKIFQNYLYSAYSYHLDFSPSELTRNATYSVQHLGYYIFHLINLFREVIAILFIVSLLLFVEPIIVLISSTFLFFVSFFFIKNFKKDIKQKAKENQNLNDLFTKYLHNSFSSIKDVKILKKEKDILNNFSKKINIFEKNLFFFQILEKLPRTTLEVFSVAFILFLCVIIFKIIDNPTEQLAILSLFAVSTIRMLPSVSSINASLNYLKIFRPSLILIYEEYEKFELRDKKNKQKIDKFYFKENLDIKKNFIISENISFKFKSKKEILNNINFSISEGETICITGATGSGKSTLFNLMLGLLLPSRGNIYFKNENILKDISLWYDNVSIVSQEPYLLETSIKNNITFNIKEADTDFIKLNKAIKISELQDTISNLPLGIETKVSTQAMNLSGGEKQRIALARAIYKDSPIFFLDEFTSAIDEKTENLIMNNLKKYLFNKTFIIISHKRKTIESCDKVWKLENGNLLKQ